VLYDAGWSALWWNGRAAASGVLVMQDDGNCVQQDSGPVWDSRTSGNPGAYLIVRDDGYVVVYNRYGFEVSGNYAWNW
jgi:hypothetical protein